jgi:predicted  nucleic acid-binding Zn-ribbon protein
MNNRIHTTIGTALLALLLAASMGTSHSQSTGAAAQPSRKVAPPAPAAAQPARGADDALLREVRLIRETLEQALGGAQREQMIVERIRTHDQRVERLDRQLTELRDEIGGIEVHVRQIHERNESLGLQIDRANDPAQRQALEAERKEMRFTQESQRQRLDRLRERESAIAGALQREERTLRGLEARLEALDRELEAEARRNNASGQLGRR